MKNHAREAYLERFRRERMEQASEGTPSPAPESCGMTADDVSLLRSHADWYEKMTPDVVYACPEDMKPAWQLRNLADRIEAVVTSKGARHSRTTTFTQGRFRFAVSFALFVGFLFGGIVGAVGEVPWMAGSVILTAVAILSGVLWLTSIAK